MKINPRVFPPALLAFTFAVIAAPPSAYVGQEARDIKSLSAEDIEGYLSGKGMGLAKAAELNGYPGPAHVLELSEQLGLTPAQRAQTEAIFASMQAEAISAGRALIDAERKLDQRFAHKAIDTQALGQSLAEIGALQARVRRAHLAAHLAQVGILTPEQNARYVQLRGYPAAEGSGAHRH